MRSLICPITQFSLNQVKHFLPYIRKISRKEVLIWLLERDTKQVKTLPQMLTMNGMDIQMVLVLLPQLKKKRKSI